MNTSWLFAFGLVAASCASAPRDPALAATPCATPILVVRNNSDDTVEVVEIRRGDMESRAIGIVAAGSTQTFEIRSSNALRYNTRPPGTRGSGFENNSVRSRVEIDRQCR